MQGGLIDVNRVTPEIAVASGNKNGAGGITKNNVTGNQDQKIDVEEYENTEHSQIGGGQGGGLLAGLL